MPLYMLQAAYANEPRETPAEESEDRGQVVATQLEELGGRLIGFYQGYGRYDAVAICELPDDFAAGNLAISVGARGHLKNVKATKLHGSVVHRYLRLAH